MFAFLSILHDGSVGKDVYKVVKLIDGETSFPFEFLFFGQTFEIDDQVPILEISLHRLRRLTATIFLKIAEEVKKTLIYIEGKLLLDVHILIRSCCVR